MYLIFCAFLWAALGTCFSRAADCLNGRFESTETLTGSVTLNPLGIDTKFLYIIRLDDSTPSGVAIRTIVREVDTEIVYREELLDPAATASLTLYFAPRRYLAETATTTSLDIRFIAANVGAIAHWSICTVTEEEYQEHLMSQSPAQVSENSQSKVDEDGVVGEVDGGVGEIGDIPPDSAFQNDSAETILKTDLLGSLLNNTNSIENDDPNAPETRGDSSDSVASVVSEARLVCGSLEPWGKLWLENQCAGTSTLSIWERLNLRAAAEGKKGVQNPSETFPEEEIRFGNLNQYVRGMASEKPSPSLTFPLLIGSLVFITLLAALVISLWARRRESSYTSKKEITKPLDDAFSTSSTIPVSSPLARESPSQMNRASAPA